MPEAPIPPSDRAPEGEPPTSPEGVDLTLIRWMLSLSPAQRLDVLEQHQALVAGAERWTPEPS